ncbi:MAG TPA: Uma2 family endonuclease, partial [Nitriliruptorales bacterium]
MEPVATGLTYDDLAALPDDGQRHELLDGEHVVTPAPLRAHQQVVGDLVVVTRAWARAHDATSYVSPIDVVFDPGTVLQPDLVVLGPAQAAQLGDPRFVDVVPDLVIEVSSPSTRAHDLVRKRRIYEDHRVPEFWFVDLDALRVEQYVLAGDRYGSPT